MWDPFRYAVDEEGYVLCFGGDLEGSLLEDDTVFEVFEEPVSEADTPQECLGRDTDGVVVQRAA